MYMYVYINTTHNSNLNITYKVERYSGQILLKQQEEQLEYFHVRSAQMGECPDCICG